MFMTLLTTPSLPQTPGPYALNSYTGSDPDLMREDCIRQDTLPFVENFHAERTASLSLHAFDSNAKLAAKTSAPSWASKRWNKTPNSQVFSGSNVIVTSGGFRNAPHIDHDATGYSSGFFALIDAHTC